MYRMCPGHATIIIDLTGTIQHYSRLHQAVTTLEDPLLCAQRLHGVPVRNKTEARQLVRKCHKARAKKWRCNSTLLQLDMSVLVSLISRLRQMLSNLTSYAHMLDQSSSSLVLHASDIIVLSLRHRCPRCLAYQARISCSIILLVIHPNGSPMPSAFQIQVQYPTPSAL